MARDRVPYLDDLKSEESLDILLGDPLSKVARAERRTLLGVSTIGIVIAKSGLVPAKITALGIEFDQADQSLLLKMLAWIVVYFLGNSDFVVGDDLGMRQSGDARSGTVPTDSGD
jgi:hypothetical protein